MALALEPVSLRGARLIQSGVSLSKRQYVGVGITQLTACTLVFFPVDDRIAFLSIRIVECIMAYMPNNSPQYPTFFESLDAVLEGTRPDDSIVTAYWSL